MDLLGELEAMASTVDYNTEVAPSDIKRWQNLFGYTADEARMYIEVYRGDFCKRLVSEEHWDLVRSVKEPQGFDIEAHSYAMATKWSPSPRKMKAAAAANAMYLLKLEGPIGTPEKVRDVAYLSYVPERSTGQGEIGDACFCTISAAVRDVVLEWLGLHHPTYIPTVVRVSKAYKGLSPHTIAPFMGRITTMPQQRPVTSDFEPHPQHDEYPVWYFFHGRLLEPDLLKRQLRLTKDPVYRPAQIRNAKMRSWRGKYNAVVDGFEEDIVEGGAFLVENEEWEESLRFFETDAYEVVRCRIRMMDGEGEEVPGLVFRFCGSDSELC